MMQYLIKQAGAIVVTGVLTCWQIGNVYAQDDQAIGILNAMGTEIASLDQFIVTGEGYVDVGLGAGQIVEHSMDVTLRMNRPSEMRITNQDSESVKEIYFEGGVLTVYSEATNFYAQAEISGDVDAAARFAVNDLGIDAPLLDFVFNDASKHLLEDAESVEYLGLSRFRDMIYHHIAVRASEYDFQLWVAAEGPPLPGKLAISMKWQAGSPRSVFFFSWNTNPDLDPKAFSAEPPATSTKIEFDQFLTNEVQ